MPHDESIPPSLLERIGIDTGRNLFVPKHFDFEDQAGMIEFIRHHPLGQMVSVASEGLPGSPGLRATAAAMIVSDGEGGNFHLLGHLARRNPHADLVREGASAIVIFQGPDAYISPRWNRESPSLPTWSYVAVQVHGNFEPLPGEAERRDVLERTITQMERDAEAPWRLDDAPPALVETLLQHIVAFRFRVEDMQGIKRLNQNRKHADQLGIIEGLRETGSPGALLIADLMGAEAARKT